MIDLPAKSRMGVGRRLIEDDSNGQRQRRHTEAGDTCWLGSTSRSAIHHHHDAQVEEHRDDARQHADDRQPVIAGAYGRLKDTTGSNKIPPSAAGRRATAGTPSSAPPIRGCCATTRHSPAGCRWRGRARRASQSRRTPQGSSPNTPADRRGSLPSDLVAATRPTSRYPPCAMLASRPACVSVALRHADDCPENHRRRGEHRNDRRPARTGCGHVPERLEAREEHPHECGERRCLHARGHEAGDDGRAPLYASGVHMWNGTAEILNANPTSSRPSA